MTDDELDKDIQKKIEQAKKAMAKRGRNYDGLGEAIEKEGHDGPYFGPRNDIEYQKLIKEIRKSGEHNDDEQQK